MAAVIAVAVQWKPHLATTAVTCLIYSCLRSALNLSLSEFLFSSPTSAVALLGLCVFPFGLAAYQASSGGSSSKPACKDKSSAEGACAADTHQQQTFQQGLPSMSTEKDAGLSESLAGSSSSSRSVKLAEPPFSAELSIPLGSNRQYLSSSSKPRRRRLPRLSVELTPLPRLSIDFSSYRQSSSTISASYARQASIRRSLDRGCMLEHDTTGMFGGSSSWGGCPVEDWHCAGSSAAAVSDTGLMGCASLQLQQQLPTHAAGEATDSLGLSELPAGLESMDDVINETHLLQVGAILGETSARGALAAREAGGPVGHPSSFYGSADTPDASEPWELVVSEGNDDVLYWGWRRPLRKGLYMYMTRSVFLGASPAELRAFMLDDAYRQVWDQSMTMLHPLLNADSMCATAAAAGTSRNSSGGGSSCSNAAVEAMAAATAARMCAAGEGSSEPATPAGFSHGGNAAASECSSSSGGGANSSEPCTLPHESAVMQALVQFPKPMASRSYVYARRVWPRRSDGGCYCLSKAWPAPGCVAVPALPSRNVGVEDYCSGCVIRAPSAQLLPPGVGAATPAAEVFMVYFEDSHVRPSLANLGIKKGLWPLVQRTEKALRVYQAGAAANQHLQPAPELAAAAGRDHAEADATAGPSSSSPPAKITVSRSASLGSSDLGCCQDRPAVVLGRSLSMQAEHTRRLSSASLPCFPLVSALDDDDTLQVESTCSTSGSNASTQEDETCKPSSDSCCSSSSSDEPSQLLTQQQQHESKQVKPSGRWGWLGRVGSQMVGVIRQSGQLLAAASVVLWRSGPSVAMLLPRFEWRLLHWAYSRLAAPRQLLLGPVTPATVLSGEVRSLSHLSSHPLSEWASRPTGLVGQLSEQVVVCRLPSHPLTLEELVQETPKASIATMRSAPASQLQFAAAAAAAAAAGSTPCGTSSAAGSTAGSDVASFSVCCSTCGCCCGGSSAGDSTVSSSSSYSHHHGQRPGSARSCSSSGGGSVVRDESGGRRHRRVVVKLVQVAGMRVARKVAGLAGICE